MPRDESQTSCDPSPSDRETPSADVRRTARGPDAAHVLVQWAPYLVPLLYLSLVLVVQPGDRLGVPDLGIPAQLGLYDDFDFAAMAQRGLNASIGRVAGWPDALEYPAHALYPADFARWIDEGPQPRLPRYFLEYPHAALLLFRIPFLGMAGEDLPAAVLDGCYGNLVMHRPRNDSERRLWTRLRWANRFYLTTMIACQLALVAVLRRGYDRNGQLAANGLLLLLPAAMYYTAYRFDIVPALLTALGLACLGRGLLLRSAFFLGTACMVKVYPVLLVPLVLRYLWHDARQMWLWLGAFVATVVAFLAPPLLASGWEAVWAPYHYQLGRGPMLWTVYGFLVPRSLAFADLRGALFRLGCLVWTLGMLALPAIPDLNTLLRRGAVMLIVFVSLAVFYSPQWVIWLLPLLVPLASGRRGLTGLIVALDLITILTWPILPDLLYKDSSWIPMALRPYVLYAVVYGRFAVLAALVVLLLRPERRRQKPIIG
jgi:hypothetical protein